MSIRDTFTRADSAVSLGTADSGQAWVTKRGTLGISSNQAYLPAAVASDAVVDVGTGDAVVRVKIDNNGGNAGALLLRYTDINNFFYLRNNNGTVYTLSKFVGGSFTQIASGTAQAHDTGDVVVVRCSGSTIKVYVNGVLDFTVTDSFNATETHFGIRGSDTLVRFSAFAAQPVSTAFAANWYVDPAGTFTGDGSLAHPWDWRTSQSYVSGIVNGYDTEWVAAGVYGTTGDPMVYPNLGADGLPVYVKRAEGAGWARIRLGLNLAPLSSAYVKYYSLEFAQDNIARTNNYKDDNPGFFDGGVVLESPYCEFHYCLVDNNAGGGWFWGESAYGARVHMCFTYHNGFCDITNGLPAGQGFYRQADDAGTSQFQYLDTCITGFNYQTGMQIYGSGASHLKFARTDKSVWFYGGFLGTSYAAGQAIHEILLGSTSTNVHADQCYFDQNWTYPPPGGAEASAVQLGYNGEDNTFVSYTNGVGLGIVDFHYMRNVEFYGNRMATSPFNGRLIFDVYSAVINALPVPAGLGWDHNTYYVTNDGDGPNHGPFVYNDPSLIHAYLTPATFFAATGFEQHSTVAPYNTAPAMWTCMGNTHEPRVYRKGVPRGFIYVFNFGGVAATVAVDLSPALAPGETFKLFDWGQYEQDDPTPIMSGTFTGAPITITLGTQTAPTLNADQTARAKHDVPPALNVADGTVPGVYYLTAGPAASDADTSLSLTSPARGRSYVGAKYRR